MHTALAQPIAAGAAGASVLDATGYVTARREATVSAQITGTLTAVLIEEGDHVKEGQVLGTPGRHRAASGARAGAGAAAFRAGGARCRTTRSSRRADAT